MKKESNTKSARNKLITTNKSEIPIKPFTLLDLGGENDPCFGTHDPKDSECKACGDSEFCQMIKAQNNHKLRAKEEKTQAFKDKDTKEHPELNKANLIKYIKAKKKKGYDELKVKKLAIKKFTPYIATFKVEILVEEAFK